VAVGKISTDSASRGHSAIAELLVLHVTYGRGSVLLQWRSDMLRTSDFMNGVIFAQSQGCSTSPPSTSAVYTQSWAWL